MAYGDLREFFPDDFDIDLNGRTLPWEAACLIPFVDEKLFLEKEEEFLRNPGYALSQADSHRNTI